MNKRKILLWSVLAALAFSAVATLDARRRGSVVFFAPPAGTGTVTISPS